MVVDDENVVAQTIASFLKSAGYRCTEAYNGRQALELAQTFRPNFIFMNVVMPGMGGFEAAARIVGYQPKCEIVFFSGQADKLSLYDALNKWGYNFPPILPKPIHPFELLRIAREAAERHGTPPPGEVRRPEGPTLVTAHDFQLMVVDDWDGVADLLSSILRGCGYPCGAAYDGDEAIELARQLRPKLIIMDIMMPRMNGIDAARRIQEEQPDCEVIFFTACSASAVLIEEALARGQKLGRIFAKPAHPQDLLVAIRECEAADQKRASTQ